MPTQKPTPVDPRFRDFDAALAEVKPIPIRLLGKDWKLPGSVPAATILRLQQVMLTLERMEQDGGELPDDFVVDESLSQESMCRQMVGDDVMDKWLALGISYEQLTAVTQYLFALHTGGLEEEPAGKGPRRPQDRQVKQSRSKASSRTSR